MHIRRRLYKGRVALPKSNKPREVVLAPEAQEALVGLSRDRELVFVGKRGGRLSQSALSTYWGAVRPLFGGEPDRCDFYMLRHHAGHHLYVRLGLPARVVAVQMGHSGPRLVETLYGHGEVDALEAIDRAFGVNVTPLRATGVPHAG